nr:immunoglobulin heavy chain junction region [Macaca mulatta]MOV38448.1 immunoglobulin heavy chain junction region [Macaca mulatta]MOV39346.1 immunoglobulin heavy chain junction region [Macaca mulatta]MOV39479.1 immunoglobulin heavy chain junction region [Macaca mulatta]MOV39953.1 immunoglobulin heavy chain junction region [Macaca mulatta]
CARSPPEYSKYVYYFDSW